MPRVRAHLDNHRIVPAPEPPHTLQRLPSHTSLSPRRQATAQPGCQQREQRLAFVDRRHHERIRLVADYQTHRLSYCLLFRR